MRNCTYYLKSFLDAATITTFSTSVHQVRKKIENISLLKQNIVILCLSEHNRGHCPLWDIFVWVFIGHPPKNIIILIQDTHSLLHDGQKITQNFINGNIHRFINPFEFRY